MQYQTSIEVTLSPPPDLVVKSLANPGKVASKDEVVITYVVENEGAGETDRSWWIDTLVSHRYISRFYFLMNNFEGTVSLKHIHKLCPQIQCKK